MGSCVSTPPKKIKLHRRRHRKGRHLVKISNTVQDGGKKRISDARCVKDFTVSQFVHMNFENGAATRCRKSGVSNSTFHLTQLQWHLSQVDSDGTFFHLTVYHKIC